MIAKIDNRSQVRTVVSIPAILTGNETSEQKWEEPATIYNLSKNSLGLVLRRKCVVGRLISLTADIPSDFRCYGGVEGDYSVWGIVQHCTLMAGEEGEENYYLGVALIGETPPASYLENPLQDYRLCGVKESGFWVVEETERLFMTRKHPRYPITVEVFMGVIDDQSNLGKGEKVTTENISIGGAAVFSNLDIRIGDCVKFIAAEYEFTALAIVRNIHQYENQKAKIRLEFIAGKFPVDKLKPLMDLKVEK